MTLSHTIPDALRVLYVNVAYLSRNKHTELHFFSLNIICVIIICVGHWVPGWIAREHQHHKTQKKASRKNFKKKKLYKWFSGVWSCSCARETSIFFLNIIARNEWRKKKHWERQTTRKIKVNSLREWKEKRILRNYDRNKFYFSVGWHLARCLCERPSP